MTFELVFQIFSSYRLSQVLLKVYLNQEKKEKDKHNLLARAFSFKVIYLFKVLEVFLLISGKTDSELQILEN